MTTRLATSLIALSAGLATPALADVTAADVWANQQAFYSSMGMTLDGIQSSASLINPEISLSLPGGAGNMSINTVALTMTDNGDGTIKISYPSPMAITIQGDAESEGSFTLFATMSHDGYDIIASGTPGDISYETNAQNVRIEVGDLLYTAQGQDEVNLDLEGALMMSSWAGTTNVKEGNLISYSSSAETGESQINYTFTDGISVSTSTQTAQPSQTEIGLSLPAGGSDIMNLSAALRDGLDIVIESTSGGTETNTKNTLNGELLNSQTSSAGEQSFALTFNEDGLVATGDLSEIGMTIFDPLVFPADLSFAMNATSVAFDVPVNASDEPQNFRVATSLQDLTVDDTIWNLFDPAGQLPRDPAEVSFDITGFGTNGTDLLDIVSLMSAGGPPAVQVDELTIENLKIAAVGAEVSATGSATFDWTDLVTFPGIARPEGDVTVNLSGANALMDRLVAMGLIPEADLMVPRMMMGMFATPVGDDELESVLEINDEGHLLANGQRLR